MMKLIAMYKSGEITAEHLVVETLRQLDPTNPAGALESLPKDVLQRILKYAGEFHPDQMRCNYGLHPTGDQVTAAKNWVEAKFRLSA